MIPADGTHLVAKNEDFAEATVYVAALQASLRAAQACLGAKQ